MIKEKVIKRSIDLARREKKEMRKIMGYILEQQMQKIASKMEFLASLE